MFLTAVFKRIVPAALLFACIISQCTPAILPDTSSASPTGNPLPWNAKQLRWISDGTYESDTPETAAVFSQWVSDTLFLRLDFLRPPAPPFDLFIQFQSNPTDSQNATGIKITFQTNGRITLTPGETSPVQPEAEQLPSDQEILIIRIKNLSKKSARYLRFSSETASIKSDFTDWIDVQQTCQPIPVHIAFSGVFKAVTPAQALRMWDGAHSGPNGTRHGLKYLLEAAKQYHFPITLLDYKNISSIELSQHMGLLQTIADLEKQGLLYLPENTVKDPELQTTLLSFNQAAAAQAGFAPSEWLYANIDRPVSGFKGFFYASNLPADNQYAASHYSLLPVLNDSRTYDISTSGLSHDWLLNILKSKAAAPSGPPPIGLLGGNFPDTSWGEPQAIRSVFSYFQNHPWLKVISPKDAASFSKRPIADFSAQCSAVLCQTSFLELPENKPWSDWYTQSIKKMNSLQSDVLQSQAAVFLSRISAISDPHELHLSWQYRNTFDIFTLADLWAQKPARQVHCMDDRQLCILSDTQTLAILSPTGAGMIALFHRSGQQLTQWVAPYSQNITSMSDPSLWKTNQGIASDPGMIEGSILTAEDRYSPYEYDLQQNSIVFTNSGRTTAVTYQLKNGSIYVDAIATEPKQWQMLFLAETFTNENHLLHLTGLEQIQCNITMNPPPQSIHSFNIHQRSFDQPEDPSASAPSGYYLPFSYHLILTPPDRNLQIEMTFP